MHGDKALLNSAYPDKFRRNIERRVRDRGINLVLGDYIDAIPEAGVVGLTTRSGQNFADADLVVRIHSSISRDGCELCL